MKKSFLLFIALAAINLGYAQTDAEIANPNSKPVTKPVNIKPGTTNTENGKTITPSAFIIEKNSTATTVKNQSMTGTCWCFSGTSLVESQCLKKNLGEYDLSEMFTVRNIYMEKARNYILRQGHAQFGEGGLGHDVIRAIATYGAVPEAVYSGLKPGAKMHNHVKLSEDLKKYLDSVLKLSPLPTNWINGFQQILDSTLGTPPAVFMYEGKKYTPQAFAKEALKFNPDEYVNITSFTHHPYYEPYIIEVPDNFSNGAYYNLPLDEMTQLVKDVLAAGYTVLWDADVSNPGFMQDRGIAVEFANMNKINKLDVVKGTVEELKWDANKRQELYENLTTQDDHLMHITGMEKSPAGKTYFIVKNSWGDIGPYHGYINVSEAYFAINTISLVVPKTAINRTLLEKIGKAEKMQIR